MDNKIKERLQELQQEWATGQKMLHDLELQQSNLQQTMLRISGAIQILEEILSQEEKES